jgi:uncharacterized phage-associated protein
MNEYGTCDIDTDDFSPTVKAKETETEESSSSSSSSCSEIIYLYENQTATVGAFQVSVFDVAAYILDKLGTISAMKLQKLVYYCQAWSLVWDESPLFYEHIEAWTNGPVVRELFEYHRGEFLVKMIPIGVPARLNAIQKETIDAVLKYYGPMTAQQLIEISHLEKPWRQARVGIAVDERGANRITYESMTEYYSSL